MPNFCRLFLIGPMVGLGRRMSMSTLKMQAGIPSSLADVSSTDLMEIERELSTAAAASQLPSETILEIARTITDQLMPQVLVEHNESQEILDGLLSPFGLCVAPASDPALAAAVDFTTTKRAEHRQCREQEAHDYFASHANCSAEAAHAEALQSAACAASTTMWHGVVTDILGDCAAAQTDPSTILDAKVALLSSQQAQYAQVAENCSQLTLALPPIYLACNNSNATWFAHREVCNTKQGDFELALCSERTASNTSCQTYSTCFQYADGNFTEKETHVRSAESSRQSQWRILNRIKCLLDVLGSGGNTSSCDQSEVNMAPVTLSYPTAPTQATCPSLGPEPCHSDFNATEYSTFPVNAPPTSCTSCALPPVEAPKFDFSDPDGGDTRCTVDPSGTYLTAGYPSGSCVFRSSTFSDYAVDYTAATYTKWTFTMNATGEHSYCPHGGFIPCNRDGHGNSRGSSSELWFINRGGDWGYGVYNGGFGHSAQYKDASYYGDANPMDGLKKDWEVVLKWTGSQYLLESWTVEGVDFSKYKGRNTACSTNPTALEMAPRVWTWHNCFWSLSNLRAYQGNALDAMTPVNV